MNAREAVHEMIGRFGAPDRTLVARGVLGTVEAAMEVAGGAAFFRRHGLEQLFRDAQGARFHPLQEGPQKAFAGRTALNLEL